MTTVWIVVQDVGFFLLGGVTFRLLPQALDRVNQHWNRRSDDDRA